MKKRLRAFTLIELMVVILILGILAALIVPRVMGRTGEAKVAAAKADLSALAGSLRNFRLDCDRYPTTEEGLNALRTPPNGLSAWKGPYLEKQLPNDPWGNPYDYTFPGSTGNDSFMLRSFGSDGVEGGTGDALDIIEGE